jgi:hypothetical protein
MAQQRLALPANIRNGLKYLSGSGAQTFLKKFRKQSKDRRQVAHTMIELIPGVFGARMGFAPEYEPKMEGQTPDWLFFDPEAKPRFFGDVLNFHLNDSLEKKMGARIQTYGWWDSDLPPSEKRLYSSITEKAGKYKELANRVDLPFVVFVYGWFEAFLYPMEIKFCLKGQSYKLFQDYPQLSGVYHFDDAAPVGPEEVNPGYRFHYYANPDASRPLALADGLVPLPIPDPPNEQ